jgi:3',5'-cyclic AMP phosphodiesterase CpdA
MASHHSPERIELSTSFYRGFIKQIGELKPVFVIHGGDVGCGGPEFHATTDQFEKSLLLTESLSKEITVPSYHVIGNHEVDPVTGSKDFFLAHLSASKSGHYSFEHGECRLILLDTMDSPEAGFTGYIQERQLSWLDAELMISASKNQRAFIFSHHPITPASGGVGHGAWVDGYEDVLDVFDKYDHIVAVFSGHWHRNMAWERRGVIYTVTAALDSYPCMWRQITVEKEMTLVRCLQIELSAEMLAVSRYGLDSKGCSIQLGEDSDRDLRIET